MSIERRIEELERLEGLDRGRQRPEFSWTEQEARALNAEIKEIEEQLRDLGADPDEWRPADERLGLSLEEHITAIERELYDDEGH